MKARERDDLLRRLQERFEANPQRHQGLAWKAVLARLEESPAAIETLHRMEASGGEPDVIGRDAAGGRLLFCDCSAESPAGRRSLCFDRAALDARKEHKPEGSAVEAALGGDARRRPRARRRSLLRPPLRQGVRLPQRRAVVLRRARFSGSPARLSRPDRRRWRLDGSGRCRRHLPDGCEPNRGAPAPPGRGWPNRAVRGRGPPVKAALRRASLP